MKPLIKWPGGKGSEIRQFLPQIPLYDRYIEPFVGGGAVYFYLNPRKALINDTSKNLMQFYAMVKAQDKEFYRLLNLYSRSFDALRELCEKKDRNLLDLFSLCEQADLCGIDLKSLKIHEPLVGEIARDPSVMSELVLDREEFTALIQNAVGEKLHRTVMNQKKQRFSEKDLRENVLTGFLSGFYLYFRGVGNRIASGKLQVSEQYATANFYFIREYCYGAMFRYNARGEFNIPYGGVSYNRKDFEGKIERMFQPDVARLLQRTALGCEDFEAFLDHAAPTEEDFIFLDPPYDTEFSDYEQHSFGHDDHRRLAQYLERTKARFLLVIKETAYIRELYEGRFRILSFDNQYHYNVRSRNDRKSQHLLITNIPEGTVPWIEETM